MTDTPDDRAPTHGDVRRRRTSGAPTPHPGPASPHAAVSDQAAWAPLVSLVPGIRLAIALVIASVVIAALYFGRDLLIPLALAILLGFLLDPMVRRLKRWGLPRMAAIMLVVTIVLGGLVGLGTYLGSQLASLGESLPQYQSTMVQKLRDLRGSIDGPGAFDGVQRTIDALQREAAGDAQPAARAKASAAARGPQKPVQPVQVVPAEASRVEMAQVWLLRISEPLVMAGIVLLFVILILLDRDGLRDRLLRLVGGNINMATEALDEAAQRIGKYLRMQLIVNVTYGFPLAVGLWFIGVPGALLWGVLAALLRYVPYVGPALAAVFPLTLAFAVGEGWTMLAWTLALIVSLELISNNIVEPWLYGESTGLSTLAIIVSATFWTALWGPIGLILATPLSVCLLVLGRSIPALGFLEVLLGSEPVLSPAQRLYQRLLVENVEGALELSEAAIDDELPDGPRGEHLPAAVAQYYDTVMVPALRLYTQLHTNVATAEQRLRFNNGMEELLEELMHEYPPVANTEPADGEIATVHCLGARWEVDAMAAAAMAHSLRLQGHRVSFSEHALGSRVVLDSLPDLGRSTVLCLAVFSPQPQAQIRHISRRIRKRWPHVRIIGCVWNATDLPLTDELASRVQVDHLVDRMHELAMCVQHIVSDDMSLGYIPATQPDNEARRLEALHRSGALTAPSLPLYRDVVRRLANAFDMRFAQVSLVDADWVHTPGTSLAPPEQDAAMAGLPREQSICAYVVRHGAPFVVEDARRDPRFARNPALLDRGVRFYAGVPLQTRRGESIGALCVMDDRPHDEQDVDIELLERMATELMQELRKSAKASATKRDEAVSDASSSEAAAAAPAEGATGPAGAEPQPG